MDFDVWKLLGGIALFLIGFWRGRLWERGV